MEAKHEWLLFCLQPYMKVFFFSPSDESHKKCFSTSTTIIHSPNSLQSVFFIPRGWNKEMKIQAARRSKEGLNSNMDVRHFMEQMSTNAFSEIKRDSGIDLCDFHGTSLLSYFPVLHIYDVRRPLWSSNLKITKSAKQWPFRYISLWSFIYYTLSLFNLLCMKGFILHNQQDLFFNFLRFVSDAMIKQRKNPGI